MFAMGASRCVMGSRWARKERERDEVRDTVENKGTGNKKEGKVEKVLDSGKGTDEGKRGKEVLADAWDGL